MKKKIYLLEPQICSTDDLNFELFYNQKLQDPNYHQSYFENQLRKYLKTEKEVCTLSSGTAAIHISLVMSNVTSGDVVFCSNSTFIATVNPILYLHAKPYFIDIDLVTGNMNMDYLEAAIIKTLETGQLPKAVIITHSYGFPAEMKRLMEIKKKYNLIIIEDAAEALGSKYENSYCGTIADFGVFSFNTNKINTTFGGGALVVSDLESKKMVQKLSSHFKNTFFDFKHDKLAYNYRMNDLAAYIGAKQIQSLKSELCIKKKIHLMYQGFFNENLIELNSGGVESNYWLNCLKIKPFSYDNLMNNLSKKNIEIRRVWYPLNKQSFLLEFDYYGNDESLVFYNKTICLPSSINLTNEDLNKIASVILNN